MVIEVEQRGGTVAAYLSLWNLRGFLRGFSGVLPHSKHMRIRPTGNSKASTWV